MTGPSDKLNEGSEDVICLSADRGENCCPALGGDPAGLGLIVELERGIGIELLVGGFDDAEGEEDDEECGVRSGPSVSDDESSASEHKADDEDVYP